MTAELMPSGPAGAGTPTIFTLAGLKRRPIHRVDLASYRKPVLPGNRGAAWRIAWYLTNVLLFQHALLGLIPSRWKTVILRAFGAEVGAGLVCKPRVNIKYPWFLRLGDHVWLGEYVWIDNQCLVCIGSNCCLSQGAYLFTGNHDWADPSFGFRMAPILLGDSVWVCAKATIGPGTILHDGDVIGTGYVAGRLDRPGPGQSAHGIGARKADT